MGQRVPGPGGKGPGGGGTPALVDHCVATGTGTCTINSTGANLIIVMAVAGGGIAVTAPTENKSNAFQAPAAVAASLASNNAAKGYYIFSPTVGASHIFTGGAASNVYFVSAWSGMLAGSGVYDTGNGLAQSGGSATLQPGSVTPAATGELIITAAMNSDNGSIWTVPSSPIAFTALDTSTGYGAEAQGYAVYASTTAINPSWTSAGTPNCVGIIAVFKHS